MKRSSFIREKIYPNSEDIFTIGSLWESREYKSGPWFLRKSNNSRNKEPYFLMGVDDGSKGGGGQIFDYSDDGKKEILRKFRRVK